MLDDGLPKKKKTLGFKYKSNLELIRENMVHSCNPAILGKNKSSQTGV